MRIGRFLWAGGMCAWLPLAFACHNEKDLRTEFGRNIAPEALKAHLEFLADDALEGRRTGTRGHEIAAKYVAAQFAGAGLSGAMPGGSFFQSVPLRRGDVLPEATTLIVGSKGDQRTFSHGSDFLLFQTQIRPQGDITAPVVFAGYGVTAPEFGYDDYQGLDVRGKIVALLSADAPSAFPADVRAYYTLFDVKRAVAADHGAVAIIGIRTPAIESGFPWLFRQRGAANGFGSVSWLDAKGGIHGLDDRTGPWADLDRRAAEALFEGATYPLSEVFASAEKGLPLHFPLNKTATIRYASRHVDVKSDNVVAVLEGQDPVLKNEYVVFTTHLDHLGIGLPVDGDAIYNGAMDNATGCAILIEIARAFRALPAPPRRSILFAATTGEEQGNLGSDYFVNNPPFPKGTIIANLNIDGAIEAEPVRDILAFGEGHSTLGDAARRAAAECGFDVSPDPLPRRGIFVRSDQYSFALAGVPAVFLSPGYRSGGSEEAGLKAYLAWVFSAYHTPKDDTSRKFDYVTGVKFARFAGWLTYKIAMDDVRPEWTDGDFFGRKFGQGR